MKFQLIPSHVTESEEVQVIMVVRRLLIAESRQIKDLSDDKFAVKVKLEQFVIEAE